jgi:putative beta-lysine N-acetyltransferase
MTDHIESIGGSVVQHGPANSRIYLMKLDPADLPGLFDTLERMASRHGYTKIFAKVPSTHLAAFQNRGFQLEAEIPSFFGSDAAAFLGRFLDPQRAVEKRPETVRKNLQLAKAKAGQGARPGRTRIQEMGPDDAPEMAELYKVVFATYPFPIHDPDYLRETMRTHVRYFGIRREDRLVALASAEMDRSSSSVEMTDFATDPTYRGHGHAARILRHMDEQVAADGLRTAFTIARAYSAGMNITFAKLGYRFAGTLTSNTDISGRIESMNVWYKSLAS